jgi:hypothetical protein
MSAATCGGSGATTCELMHRHCRGRPLLRRERQPRQPSTLPWASTDPDGQFMPAPDQTLQANTRSNMYIGGCSEVVRSWSTTRSMSCLTLASMALFPIVIRCCHADP